MNFQYLRAAIPQEREQWLAALDRLPVERRDVYFLPEYLESYVDNPRTEAACVVCAEGDAVLVYPFLKSLVSLGADDPAQPQYDLQSAYGYGGPAVNAAGEEAAFLREAWLEFARWCKNENVVSEFVRFHPLLDNVRWASAEMRTFMDRTTVPIPLESYESAMRGTSYYRVHRQMLNKSERVGFSFHILPAHSELSWFVPLYQETQDFLQAGADTRFGMAYFSKLAEGFGERAWLGVVKQEGEVRAAAMVLEGPLYLHSHLMGYRRDGQTAGMTNLLYHGIAVHGAAHGKTILHMGGGRTSDEKDSLFKFKESLSPERASFWLGTLCHNQEQYEELGRRWEERHGPRPKNYFQFYRLQGSDDAV
jgi:hypothetical protein